MQFYSAPADRNKGPIMAVLAEILPRVSQVLEIGSGTGQHALFFAEQMPHLQWLPTDLAETVVPLNTQLAEYGLTNIAPALPLDVRELPWNINSAEGPVDLVYTTNTLHIMGWDGVEAFFQGVDQLLAQAGYLVVYGPFKYAGAYTTESNAEFDRWLKNRDPQSGIRDFEAVLQLAENIGLQLLHDHPMPANNQCLIWQRG